MTKITVDKALIEQAIAAMPDRIGVSRFALRQKLRAALAEPAVEPVGHEQCKAIQESERNAAETNYFKARPQIDCIDRRNVFCAGFDRGFDAQKPAPVREPAPVQEPVAWWKQYPDGSISVVESRTFLAEDAVAMGWRALGFTDVAPQAQQPAPVQKSECGRYTWVPVKPSTAMLIAGSHCQPGDYSASLVWEEMIACADRTDYLRPIDPPNTQQKSPPADVPLLTPKEIEGAWIKELGATFGYGPFARAIEQAVRQKAGLK